MPELTRGPASWPEADRSRNKGMFPASESPGLDLVERTRNIVGLS